MDNPHGPLDGKRVAVVGGTSGIGLEIARQSLDRGATVVVAGRDPQRAAAAARELGPGAEPAVVDLGEQGSVVRFAESHDDMDHLVITAGKPRRAPVLTTPWDEVAPVFRERYVGTYELTRLLGPSLRPNGSIVLFSSATAEKTRPGSAVLASAFAALEVLARFLALELAPKIRVNVIRPGLIDTPLHRRDSEGGEPPPGIVSMARSTPLARFGSADEVADAAMFLLTNPFMTGTVVAVNGGLNLV